FRCVCDEDWRLQVGCRGRCDRHDCQPALLLPTVVHSIEGRAGTARFAETGHLTTRPNPVSGLSCPESAWPPLTTIPALRPESRTDAKMPHDPSHCSVENLAGFCDIPGVVSRTSF